MKKTRKSYPKQDLTGKKIGMLTPLEWLKGGKWRCVCECGNITVVDTRNLNTGHTQSCGCKNRMSKNAKNMIGFENEYIKVLERSKGNDDYARWICLCKRCGNLFETKGANLRNRSTCSCGCLTSINESKIKAMLTEEGIEFATQYTFPELKGLNGGNLRFDFAIFKDGKLDRLIEFNGSQHYIQPQGSWKNNFETTKAHDQIKKEFCKSKGIKLVTVRYDEEYSLKTLLE